MTTEKKFDWCEYYHFANSFKQSSDSVELRNGISRFYYSAFCTCRDYLINHNYNLGGASKRRLTSGKPEVHKETRKIFSKHRILNTSGKGDKISRELERSRIKRNKADYESRDYDAKNDYIFVKHRIKKIFDYLEEV